MLSDLPTLRTFLGITNASDNTQDDKLTQLLVAADSAVKKYCKQDFEFQVYTEYPFRLGGEAIVVLQTPVLSYRLTGNVTSAQPQITGLPSTSNLLVGMPVLQAITYNGPATQPFPNGVTIQSIDTSSQVTLTGNATQTLSGVQLLFGLAVWYDPQGAFGDGMGSDPSGPFGPTSLLRQGLDYALQRDQNDGTSKSGKLTRLASLFGYLGLGGGWGAYGSAWAGLQSRSTLSSYLKPLWPDWPAGAVKVVYAAGLGQGAVAPNGLLPKNTTIPPQLTEAVNGLAAWSFRNANTGLIQTQSTAFQGYNAQVAMMYDALKSEGPLGDVRSLLSRFRRVSI